MNAGAYVGDFSTAAVSLKCVSPEGEIVEVAREQAQWGYRHSMMADAGYVVVEATLELSFDAQAEIRRAWMISTRVA